VLANRSADCFRECAVADQLTHLSALFAEFHHIFGVHTPHDFLNPRTEMILVDVLLIRLYGDSKPVGHPNAEVGQVLDHFPQRGIFAAHTGQIGQGDVAERYNIFQKIGAFYAV